MLTKTKFGLSGNALKCIAMACMLLDHMGYILFPGVDWMRIVGRLAYPIYGFLLAEGCRYTRRRWLHFLEVFVLGVICQAVYQLAAPYPNGIYLNILLTFSVSIVMCNLLLAVPKESIRLTVFFVGAVLLWFAIDRLLTLGIKFDYGYWGILLPVVLVLFQKPWQKLLAEAGVLCVLSAYANRLQWWCLLALLPLALYNGTRGRRKLKYAFYLFYPLHLVALYGVYWLLVLCGIF